jgi:L-threonylcarbamoyladenylate synthase
VEILAPDGQSSTAAARLFAALRRLDAHELDAIVAEPCEERGLGRAIMDRLRRSAARG